MKNLKKIKNKIFFGITGQKPGDWESKIKELDTLKIREATLFLSSCKPNWRPKVYKKLLDSKINYIPMLHLRHDMEKEELEFFFKKFKTRYFTIHQDHFTHLENWRGYFKYLYLEFGLPLNKINKTTDINKIGGLCVDCSHYMFEKKAKMIEADYIDKRKNRQKLFGCNHLNGYNYIKNSDVHKISSVKDFDYIRELPEYIFGDIIGLEMENSIIEQAKYLDYLISTF